MHRAFFIVAVASVLAGCASIVEGVTQKITVDVNPGNGTCILTRDGEALGVSSPGNRVVTVSKSRKAITFTCSAPGYATKVTELTSDLAAATVASFVFLDLGIVDAATGAWQKYPTAISVTLEPEQPELPARGGRNRRS